MQNVPQQHKSFLASYHPSFVLLLELEHELEGGLGCFGWAALRCWQCCHREHTAVIVYHFKLGLLFGRERKLALRILFAGFEVLRLAGSGWLDGKGFGAAPLLRVPGCQLAEFLRVVAPGKGGRSKVLRQLQTKNISIRRHTINSTAHHSHQAKIASSCSCLCQWLAYRNGRRNGCGRDGCLGGSVVAWSGNLLPVEHGRVDVRGRKASGQADGVPV